MRKLSTRILALASLVSALSLAAPVAYAQDAAGDENKEMSREERLRQHEKRVREIIEERRKAQLERNKTDTEVAPQPDEAPAPAQDDKLPRLGRVILTTTFPLPDGSGRASDTVVRKGERFISDVILQNEGGTSFDRVVIALKFDKRFMKPLKVFDDELRPYVKGEPKFTIIQRDSILLYEAQLEKPRVVREMPVLRIAWEATRSIEHTGLNFVFASGDTDKAPHTAVYQNDRNILGSLDDPIDGVLGSSILVLKPVEADNTRPEVLQGKQSELRTIYLNAVGADTVAGMELKGPDQPVAAGEEFAVDVVLRNPEGAIIDGVQFAVKFDPEVLQVIDRDRGNWMRRGTNVEDAPFRFDYPFDFHKRNEADNVRGLVYYSMGLGDSLALPSGTFARIHFRAIKPADLTEVSLVSGRQGAVNLTALNTFGYNIMTADPRLTKPVYATSILKEPLDRPKMVANANGPEDLPAPPQAIYSLGVLPTVESVSEQLSHR